MADIAMTLLYIVCSFLTITGMAACSRKNLELDVWLLSAIFWPFVWVAALLVVFVKVAIRFGRFIRAWMLHG